MTTGLWLYVALRMLICVAAGEIAIRYSAWSYLLARAPGPPILSSPIIFGVALWAFARFLIEGRWVSLLLDPHRAATFVAIDGNDPVSAFGRTALVVALCFLTFPVTKIQYRNSKERALMELSVRLFLVTTSIIVGWVLATIYFFHA